MEELKNGLVEELPLDEIIDIYGGEAIIVEYICVDGEWIPVYKEV
ncbi:MAG: hypothetical protein ACK5ND_01800 [Bacteroides sp.]